MEMNHGDEYNSCMKSIDQKIVSYQAYCSTNSLIIERRTRHNMNIHEVSNQMEVHKWNSQKECRARAEIDRIHV